VFTVTEAEEPFDALFGAGAQVRVHRYGADGRGGLARPDLITDLRALLARHGWAAAE
jgi:hypothetical protein